MNVKNPLIRFEVLEFMDENRGLEIPKIGTRIRKVREMKDFSQENMSLELGMSVSGYSRIERNEVRITIDKLFQICKILEVRIEDLLSIGNGYKFYKSGYYQDDLGTNSSPLSMDELYKFQIDMLTEEVRYLREILSKLT